VVNYHYWACYKQGISRKTFFYPYNAKDSEEDNREEDIIQHNKNRVYLQNKSIGATNKSVEPYASSGWHSNRSATSFTVSRTPTCVASGTSLVGPYTSASRETWGSWLRKHISTCSTTASAWMRPSVSSRLPTTSSSSDILMPAELSSGSLALTPCAGTLDRKRLNPKDTSADSAWPKKSHTFYASPARIAWRSSSLF
jgi:hypothetical protein